MGYKFNFQSLGIPLDQVKSAVVISATAPTSTDVVWINTADNLVYLYWGSWQSTGITLTPAALEYLLLETGDFFLLETGDKLALG